jgi:hypothetical protein
VADSLSAPLTERERRALAAAVDAFIPPDDYPGAAESGVPAFIERLLTGDAAEHAPLILHGLTLLDETARAERGTGFADLPRDARSNLLARLEAGCVDEAAFVTRLLHFTMEGYYSDPANGGNPGAVSWRMVGFDPARTWIDPDA